MRLRIIVLSLAALPLAPAFAAPAAKPSVACPVNPTLPPELADWSRAASIHAMAVLRPAR